MPHSHSGPLPRTPSEVTELRNSRHQHARLRRILQVREIEKRVAREKRDTYQALRREGRRVSVEKSRQRETSRIISNTNAAKQRLNSALISLGSAHSQAELASLRTKQVESYANIHKEENDEMTLIRNKTAAIESRKARLALPHQMKTQNADNLKTARVHCRALEVRPKFVMSYF